MDEKRELETELRQLCYFKNHPVIPWLFNLRVECICQAHRSHGEKADEKKKRQLHVSLRNLRGSSLRWEGVWKEKHIQQMTKRGGFQLSLNSFAYLLLLGCQHLNRKVHEEVGHTACESVFIDIFFATELGIPSRNLPQHSRRHHESLYSDKLYLTVTWKKNGTNPSFHFPLPLVIQLNQDVTNSYLQKKLQKHIKPVSKEHLTEPRDVSSEIMIVGGKQNKHFSSTSPSLTTSLERKNSSVLYEHSSAVQPLHHIKNRIVTLKKKLQHTVGSLEPQSPRDDSVNGFSSSLQSYDTVQKRSAATPPCRSPVNSWLRASERLSNTTPPRLRHSTLSHRSRLKAGLKDFPVTFHGTEPMVPRFCLETKRPSCSTQSLQQFKLSVDLEERHIHNNPVIRNAIKRTRSLSKALKSLNAVSGPFHTAQTQSVSSSQSVFPSCGSSSSSAESPTTSISITSNALSSKSLKLFSTPLMAGHKLSVGEKKQISPRSGSLHPHHGRSFKIDSRQPREPLSYRTPSVAVNSKIPCPSRHSTSKRDEIQSFSAQPLDDNDVEGEIFEKLRHLKQCVYVKHSDVKTSGVKTSGMKIPGVKTSGVKTSGMKIPGVKTSGVKTSGVKTSGMNTPNSQGLKIQGILHGNPLESRPKLQGSTSPKDLASVKRTPTQASVNDPIVKHTFQQATDVFHNTSSEGQNKPSVSGSVALGEQEKHDVAASSCFQSEDSLRNMASLTSRSSTEGHLPCATPYKRVAQRISNLRQEFLTSEYQSR